MPTFLAVAGIACMNPMAPVLQAAPGSNLDDGE
jgi:hypothetical protein